MKALQDAGLRGANLFLVETEELVARYNACLEHLSIAPTMLEKFSIDKMGWSPEIAEEQGDDFYLSHGVSNAVGVILSIEQARASLHFPYFSFDKFLMTRVYEELGKSIADITTQTGICLEIENGISAFASLFDLLMVEYYEVKFSTPMGLGEAARRQKELIMRFEQDPGNWQDIDSREAILASAKEFGDLRRRNLLLHPIYFDETRSFFTKSFEGVFVFRELPSGEDLMVLKKKRKKEILENPYENLKVIDITEKDIIRRLVEAGIFHVDMSFFRQNISELHRIKDDILADVVCKKNPKKVDFASFSSSQRKAFISDFGQEIAPTYFEIERLIRFFEMGKDVREVSPELQRLLLRPVDGPLPFQETAFILLSVVVPEDIVRLYRFNKELFYNEYATWSESKKKWAIWRIMNHYKQKGPSS